MRWRCLLIASLVLLVLLAGCQSSVKMESFVRTEAAGVFTTQTAEAALRTQAAGEVLATQIAAQPSATPAPSATPVPSATPAPTATPIPSATSPSLPDSVYRPETGEIILDRRPAGGSGELEVENGGNVDGLVVVVDLSDIALTAFYIRYGSTYTLNGIPDGVYRIYFSTGEAWDGLAKAFSISYSYERFDDLLDFATTASQYTIWTLTLQPVVGGDAQTSSVDPADFPEIK